MEDKNNRDLKQRLNKYFETIPELQESIVGEKKAGGDLYKDYINSLGLFPQWLTIFSGVAGILNIFNKTFLSFAFLAFLASALLLLSVKRSASKRTLAYLNSLNFFLKETANFTYKMTKFSRGEISEEEIKKEEKSFYDNYHKMRENIYIEDDTKEDYVTKTSFWLSVAGGVFLIFSLLLNC